MSVYQWVKLFLLAGILGCLVILVYIISDINGQLEFNNEILDSLNSYVIEIYDILDK